MTSASTLARRARAEKNPRKAKKLRAEAAKLRREEREAKAFQASTVAELNSMKNEKRAQMLKRVKKRKARKPGKAASKTIKGLNQALEHAKRFGLENGGWRAVDNAARAASPDAMPLAQLQQERPGKGEIVGGELARKAEEIAKLARKKGGIDAIQKALEALAFNRRHEATREMTERMNTVAKDSNKRWGDAIVTGFMARCLGMEAANGRGLPDYVVVDGVTLARVVDALTDAGYTAQGKR